MAEMTRKQADALARLMYEYDPTTVRVSYENFDLPEGYVSFSLERAGTFQLVGGISAEGEVST